MIVADSDVLIDALRGREPSAGRIRELIEAKALATTSVSCFELLSGAKVAEETEAVRKLLRPIPILPIDEAASRAAADARSQLEEVGKTIGLADYLIAGICLVRALPIMTRNRKNFERVEGLRLA